MPKYQSPTGRIRVQTADGNAVEPWQSLEDCVNQSLAINELLCDHARSLEDVGSSCDLAGPINAGIEQLAFQTNRRLHAAFCAAWDATHKPQPKES